jgi:hypothetical protein
MPLPWMTLLDAAIGVTDLALSRRGKRRTEAADGALTANGPNAGALGNLETRLAGVVVAALKEAFDRDTRRLDLEREQAEAERLRAERLLRLELRRQAADREIGVLRVTAGVAVASLLGTLFFSTKLVDGGVAARVVVGVGWTLLLAALAASFLGQSSVTRSVARADPIRDEALPASPAGTLAAVFIVLGLALIVGAVLIA